MDTLYHKLHKISEKNKISFHMPGTRGGLALPQEYLKDVFQIDFTELRETDNLYAPSGIIKQAQIAVAEIYKAKNSFFLVNGASGGILAAFGYMSQFNKKILVDRNCHISAVNAISVFGLTAVFVMPEYKQEWGHMGCPQADEIEKILQSEKDIGCVFITSPNYYGWNADIKKISAVCEKYGALLCVDAAHGAHFPFYDKLPESAVEAGGDIVVMSMHKTLPSPSQTAVLHTSCRVDTVQMKKWVNIFQTTSPSYILMGYSHLAVEYMMQNGQSIYNELFRYIHEMPTDINIIKNDRGRDFSRIVINTSAYGKTGYQLSDYLYNEFDIEIEMVDLYNVVCIAGAGNTERHFEALARGCAEFKRMANHKAINILPPPPYSSAACRPADFLYAEKKICKIEESVHQIAGEQLSVYPPGIPVVLPGERITKEIVEYVREVKNAGGTIVGMDNGTINIVKP